MRRAGLAVAVVVLLGGSGCGDDVPRFELDVSVGRTSAGATYVFVHGIDVAAACPHAVHEPPAPGVCNGDSDGQPPPCGTWRCVSGFGVEVNGATIGSRAAPPDLGNVSLDVPALSASDQAVLVVEGCGTSARIPLPGEPLATPTVTRFAYEDGAHVFEWEGAPGADSAEAYVTGGFVGAQCRTAGRDVARVPLTDPYVSVSTFAAVADEGTVDTPYGPAHLTRTAGAEVPAQEVPPVPQLDLDVTVTNTGLPGELAQVSVHAIDVDAACPMPRHAFPPAGTCDAISDAVPAPCGSWECITSIAVELNGTFQVSDNLPTDLSDYALALSPFAPSDAAVLVIEGCGTSARVPLPTMPLAPPTVTSVTQVSGGYDFAWEGAEGATSAMAVVEGLTVGSFRCQTDGRDTAHVTTSLLAVSSASLTALADEGRVATPYGTVQLWRAAEVEAPPPGAP